MGETMYILGILFVTIVLPLWIILHYVTKWKKSRELSGTEEEMLEEIWTLSQNMESRLNALETILDDEVPDWRRKT
ncbi:envelope stress response membrane protein PspB [Lentisalinibacter salinarum]|jgi:phage shock protein B|uniref:envelope stress response membrane protein PspB n=2 Tax=Lentisalinibacter TaxID=3382081 RepID=UPI00386BCFDF